MSKEFKALSFTNIKAQADGRIRAGVAAVFGNVDDWEDRIQPGAFKKTIAEGQGRCRHLWNHDSMTPPIASIKELRELSRDELPEEVLQKSPEATGGLLVKREYYNNDLANWVLEAIDKGDVNEMSFAYDVVKSTYSTEEIEGTDRTREIRELLELRLYDTSDVNWGMNSATVAAGAKFLKNEMPLGLIYSNLLAIQEKAGEVSKTDRQLLELIKKCADEMGAKSERIETAEEQPKNNSEQNSTEESQAEAVASLTSLGLKISALEIENFNFLGD